MTPWQKAKHWWDNHSTQDFWEAVGEHLSAGYVFSSPELFCLAKELRWDAETQTFSYDQPNCWFVTLAASTGRLNPVSEFLRMTPHPQTYVAWCRRGSFDPRVYSMEQLMKKVGG